MNRGSSSSPRFRIDPPSRPAAPAGPLRLLLLLLVASAIAVMGKPARAVPPSEPPRLEQKESDYQREYFDRWYGPMSPERVRKMWDEVRAVPAEAPRTDNSWQLVGPLYSVNPGGGKMTGRVRDIDAVNSRVLSATGGLWRFYFGPLSMTDQVPASWFGSFATRPSDPNTILLGTGEYTQGGGTGLYKTTDAGATWFHQELGGDPYWISKVRWNYPGTTAYVASNWGIYVSTDAGLTWNLRKSGDFTDLVPVPSSNYPNLVYATQLGNGLWRSSDGGTTWVQMTSGGIPTSGTGHGAVSVMWPGQFQGVWIYVSFASAGVWRSTDGGLTWTNITPSPDVNRFDYNNVIAVSPVDGQRVFLGGVGAKYSSNGGSTWISMVTPHLHADYHAFAFDPGGTGIWAGNDGGWSHSTDLGVTWDSSLNVMPITQFYDVACERTEIGMMVGTSQDNNVEYSPNESLIWTLPAIGSTEGDGTGAAVDQFTSTRIWAIQGVYGAPYSYERQRSTDGGATWQEIDNGIDPNTHAGRIRQDGVFNPWLATCAGPYVYRSTDFGSSWAKANNTAFPGTVVELTSTARATPDAVLYAVIGTTASDQRLYVRDTGVWLERDFGLPPGVSVRTVAVHPYSGNYTDEGWALMNGTGSPGEKVFHTSDRGVTWVNITGNLPNVPMGDLAPDPWNTNRLFLGTALGCFKTTDGGASWVRWNNGMPQGMIVNVMSTIDTRGSGGPLYIVAGTYGRSVLWRDASGDDPAVVLQEPPSEPSGLQVSPNPLSSAADLSFVLRRSGPARVDVYDTGGRRVETPLDGNLEAGHHVIRLDGSRLATGTYYIRLEVDGDKAAKRVIVIR